MGKDDDYFDFFVQGASGGAGCTNVFRPVNGLQDPIVVSLFPEDTDDIILLFSSQRVSVGPKKGSHILLHLKSTT